MKAGAFLFCWLAAAAACGCASAPGRCDWITVGPIYTQKDYARVQAYSFKGLKKDWRAIGLIRSPLVEAGNRARLQAYVLDTRKLAAQYGADAVVLKVVDKSQEPNPDGNTGPAMAYIWAVAVKLEENIKKETPLSTDVFAPENQGLPGLVSDGDAPAAGSPAGNSPAPVERAVEQFQLK
ncbi:MAG: hypothetical protein PHW69_03540 [Elusimicrobiaceae bacterium]|nr:hypothetical protein [Elusimicrobiaceae bacterium]